MPQYFREIVWDTDGDGNVIVDTDLLFDDGIKIRMGDDSEETHAINIDDSYDGLFLNFNDLVDQFVVELVSNVFSIGTRSDSALEIIQNDTAVIEIGTNGIVNFVSVPTIQGVALNTYIESLVGGDVPAENIDAGTFGVGNYVFPADLSITSALDVGTNLTITDDLDVGGNAVIDGNLEIGIDLIVGANAAITGTLDVTGISTLATVNLTRLTSLTDVISFGNDEAGTNLSATTLQINAPRSTGTGTPGAVEIRSTFQAASGATPQTYNGGILIGNITGFTNTPVQIYVLNDPAYRQIKVGANGTGPGGVGRALYVDNG